MGITGVSMLVSDESVEDTDVALEGEAVAEALGPGSLPEGAASRAMSAHVWKTLGGLALGARSKLGPAAGSLWLPMVQWLRPW